MKVKDPKRYEIVQRLLAGGSCIELADEFQRPAKYIYKLKRRYLDGVKAEHYCHNWSPESALRRLNRLRWAKIEAAAYAMGDLRAIQEGIERATIRGDWKQEHQLRIERLTFLPSIIRILDSLAEFRTESTEEGRERDIILEIAAIKQLLEDDEKRLNQSPN